MAECTAYTAIIVSGAGITNLNGTYIPYSTNIIQEETFTVFTKDGLNSDPRIITESVFSDNYIWVIRERVGGPQYQSRLPGDSFYQTTEPLNCPNEVAIWVALDGSASLPIVTGVAKGNFTFGLPAETVALVTSRFGTVANYLRLRNLGQI
jgi:hypothetical protein